MEYGWGITQPKQHVFTLKEPNVSFMCAQTSSFIGWDSPEPLLEGLAINDPDLMFHQVTTAQHSRFQGKDVMVFS